MDKNGSGASVSEQGKKKKMKELKAAYNSARSPEQLGDALLDMQHSGLFHDKGLGFETWKLAQFSIDGNFSFLRSTVILHENWIKQIQFSNTRAGPRQKNLLKARHAFYCAKTLGEMLKAFQTMESLSEEKDLGFDCWRLTQKLHEDSEDPEKTLSYGKRALNYSLDRNNASNQATLIIITNTLPMLGYACLKLKRFDESLIYLNWSQRNLSKLEQDSSFPDIIAFSSLVATHFNLAVVKTVFGKGEEAVVHLRKMLEVQEKVKTEGSIDEAVDDVVEELEGLGVIEQEEVNVAVRLLKEMKERASGEESPKKTSKCPKCVQDGTVI